MSSDAVEHQNAWLATQSAEQLRKWIRKNSCLCDMAGICNGCVLAEVRAELRNLKRSMHSMEDELEGGPR